LSVARPVALYDANVLYSAPVRDLLMWLARAGLVAARWTDAIHEEWMRNLLHNRADLKREQVERTRGLMEVAVPGALVRGYEHRIAGLSLPDPDDRHVLAAAIEAGAEIIVTFNLADFPPAALDPYEIRALSPDEFVMELGREDPDAVVSVARVQRANLRNPPATVDEHLASLARVGLRETAAWLEGRREHL
jgi:predicted nucleic acid-binding protein